MLKKYPFNLIGLAAFVLIFFFNNCSPDRKFDFKGEEKQKIEVSLGSSQGTGEGYFGKPEEGDYDRSFPSFKCNGNTADQGHLKVTANSVQIIDDNCTTKEISFAFSDSLLEYSPYNRDFLGVGTAMYRLNKSDQYALPVTEAWCRFKADSAGVDVVITVDHQITQSRAKIYLGYRNTNSEQWTARTTEEFSVSRSQNGKDISFASSSMQLQLSSPTAPNTFGNGHLRTMVDGIVHDHDVSCRVANSAAVEEMNTGLAQLYTLNLFTTDTQESLCSNPMIYACENFEDRLVRDSADLSRPKYKNIGSQLAFPSNQIGVGTAEAFDGNKSFEFAYPAGSSTGWGNLAVSVPQPATSTVYIRHYAKWSSNFVWSPVETDLFFVWPTGDGTPITFIVNESGRLAFMPSQTDKPTIASNYSFTLNQWHCLEYGIKYNSSPSNADGSVEMWVDGVKIFDLKNHLVSSISGAVPDEVSLGSYWYCRGGADQHGNCLNPTDPANIHPAQSVWYDSLIIGKQRIGCY